MSKLIDGVKVTGCIELINAKGEVVRKANLVVDGGKEWIASRMAGGSNPMTHIGVGTGASAATGANTTLGAQIARKVVTVAGGTAVTNTLAFETTFVAGEGTGALTEVGLFDSASGGVMVARSVFPVYNKGALDLLNVRWTLTIS
jgi:hypothetical protein